jgi:formylglycine-generating enzyme required for sulfatase activity
MLPDPNVVTDATLRAGIVATGLPWRVRDNASQIEMLLVPPGTFEMGCSASEMNDCHNRESPVHQVTLNPGLYLGRYEVKQSEWLAVMGTNPSYFKSLPDAQNHPVEWVSWGSVHTFLMTTGLRLPTEAEWEYACRAGTSTAFHSFAGFQDGTNDDGLLPNIAWFAACCGGNSGWQTHPVGQKMANGLGLHDMLGNVHEWVSDWLSDTYYANSPQLNPTGPMTGTERVHRGGSWYDTVFNARSSARGSTTPNTVYFNLGFRAARNP